LLYLVGLDNKSHLDSKEISKKEFMYQGFKQT